MRCAIDFHDDIIREIGGLEGYNKTQIGYLNSALDQIQNDDYYPTFRAKLYYALMYPVGIATGSLSNYQKFCAEVEKNNKDISSEEIMQ